MEAHRKDFVHWPVLASRCTVVFFIAIMKCLVSLQSAMRRHLRNILFFYLVGHSLGGSLATATASMMTHFASFSGEKRVIMFGSPPIFYDTAPSMDHSPTILKTCFELLVSATRNIGRPTASLRQIVHKSVEIASKYVHPEGLELVVLKGA